MRWSRGGAASFIGVIFVICSTTGWAQRSAKIRAPYPDVAFHEFIFPNLDGPMERRIDKALEKGGFTRGEVDYLATLLVKRSAHDYLMDQIGLPAERTRYLAEFGHHGQNDQLLSLELALEEGRLTDGDLVLMISAGIGYAWSALSLRWGAAKEEGS